MKHDHFGNIFLTILLDLYFFSRLQEEEIDLSELLELGVVFLEDFEKSGRCFLSIEREKISTSLLIRKSSYLQIFNYCFHSFRSFDSLMEEILHNVYLDFHLRLNQKPDFPFFDKYDVSYPENFLQHNNIIFEEKSSC
ncbi:hypothetical protein LEP1GSC133_1828 [Leptospira borgpetersenii serovar Pomona str. 200901868]|uniref:Uncharacterized protein n=1 Tax=Leptospira borgpetersenii serovar Pomona str. 200901868 TaxID=1192866 RepID=M6W0C2_LEPBO|nr:hypothetical protein LEP1GSC133_1828 [Leptospira borgpetersenii serovar Pomona str. 200901868]